MPCGHTIHKSCLEEMTEHHQWVLQSFLVLNGFLRILCRNYFLTCLLIHQICLPNLFQISLWHVKGLGQIWCRDCCHTNARTLSKQDGTPLPVSIYGCKSTFLKSCITKWTSFFLVQVWILCNDCGETSHVQFHVVAQKCPNCKSYNTRQTRGWICGWRVEYERSLDGTHDHGTPRSFAWSEEMHIWDEVRGWWSFATQAFLMRLAVCITTAMALAICITTACGLASTKLAPRVVSFFYRRLYVILSLFHILERIMGFSSVLLWHPTCQSSNHIPFLQSNVHP